MISKVFASAYQGIRGVPVAVEVDCSPGLPGFSMVGLPDGAAREARERVYSAMRTANFRELHQRITVNLAPAAIRKEGSSFDLALAIGLLLASEQIAWSNSENWMLLGELSLDGLLRPVKGVLSAAFSARQRGLNLLVPQENLAEALLVDDLKVVGVDSLKSCAHWIKTGENISQKSNYIAKKRKNSIKVYDFAEVYGLAMVKRALEIAAAGNHNFLMIGSPGSGKTFCAQCMPSILPKLTPEERLESVMIHSCAGLMEDFDPNDTTRPFRAPHHTASVAALVGGGRNLRPGEISLAHGGLLFLDELPELSRNALDRLRQPLEQGKVVIARAMETVEWPAQFLLGAALNPCPCGYYGDAEKECTCSPMEVLRYNNRVSGPLLDRLDITIKVPRQGYEAFAGQQKEETSAQIRSRVVAARKRQYARSQKLYGKLLANGNLGADQTREICKILGPAEEFLRRAVDKMGLSTRGVYRVVRVARTIADLRNAEIIELKDLAEALQYRNS